MLATAAVGGILFGVGLGSSAATPVAHSAGAAVASVNLSHGELYEGVAVVGGKLIVFGGPDGAPFASASSAAPPASAASQGCHSAVVDPVSLTLWHERSGNCDDPSLYGVRAMVVNEFINGTTDGGTVRIAHSAPTASGFALGPILMTYTELSDTDAEWVYGDGFLWVFDPLTTAGSELLRISETTGALLQRVAMPRVDRPLLAADADGLWIAPASNSGFQPLSATGLYHLAPGMTRPARVKRLRWSADWMLAAGHSVWIEINHAGKSETLWRLDGAHAKVVLEVQSNHRSGFGEFGYGQRTVAGDAADGIWTVTAGGGPQQGNQEVMRIDASTGRTSTLASVTPPGGNASVYNGIPVVVLDGSLFFLDPATVTYPGGTSGAVVKGPSALYRVTPGI